MPQLEVQAPSQPTGNAAVLQPPSDVELRQMLIQDHDRIRVICTASVK